jgi:hypothetical protein
MHEPQMNESPRLRLLSFRPRVATPAETPTAPAANTADLAERIALMNRYLIELHGLRPVAVTALCNLASECLKRERRRSRKRGQR